MNTNQSASREKTRLHPNIWVLTVVSFLTDISSEMLFNLLPLFLANVLGVRTAAIGLIDGMAESTASLVKIYSGALSDRLGKRKTLAVVGYGFSTLVKPLLYFATSWGWVLGVRFSDRIGKGIRNAPRDALLAGSVGKEQRGFAFGLHRAGDTAGAFTGLGIAALIIWATQGDRSQLSRGTFQIVVLASVIPALLAVIILLVAAKEVGESQPHATPMPTLMAGWRQMDQRFKAFLAVIVLFTMGNSSDAFIILRGQERGLNVMQIMGMILTFNAMYSLLSWPIGALSDRVERQGIIIIGWLLYSLVYLGLAVAKSGAQVWMLYAAYGIYYALTEGVAKALVADFIPQAQRGTAYGLYNAAVGLAMLPASLIAGILWQGIGGWKGFGPSAPFLVGAAMALLSSVLLLAWVRSSQGNPAA
ncbi:MAG: MFS transporter [Anaerolineales bacterium]|nr:MAG: MFS transporter [Anaerolineales bacterium]